MKFLTTKPFSGVHYEMGKTHTWAKKSQVPNVRELPTHLIETNCTRFNPKYKYFEDEPIYKIFLTPIKEGDVFSYMGLLRGVVSSIEVVEEYDGFIIRITCQKSFEKIYDKTVLLDKETIYEISMYNFFYFFSNIDIKDKPLASYETSVSLVPSYQKEIQEMKTKIRDLELELKNERLKTADINKAIDERIYKRESTIHYNKIAEIERNKPKISQEQKDADAENIKEYLRLQTSRIAGNLRQLYKDQALYDSMPNLDIFGGKRP